MRAVYATLVDGLVGDYQRPRTRLDKGQGEFHLRTLLKMAQWAADHQPVAIGDQVHLCQRRCRNIEPTSGWHYWRDELADGPHEVVGIDFNGVYDYWYFVIVIGGYTFNVPMSWLDADATDRQLQTGE